jgi:hypothetical protein
MQFKPAVSAETLKASPLLQACSEHYKLKNSEQAARDTDGAPNGRKRPIHSQLNWAILLCDVIPDTKAE